MLKISIKISVIVCQSRLSAELGLATVHVCLFWVVCSVSVLGPMDRTSECSFLRKSGVKVEKSYLHRYL